MLKNSCIGVTKRMDVQLLRKAMLFQDQLEPPGEGAGSHRLPAVVLAEDVVIVRQGSILIRLRLPTAFAAIFLQETRHLR